MEKFKGYVKGLGCTLEEFDNNEGCPPGLTYFSQTSAAYELHKSAIWNVLEDEYNTGFLSDTDFWGLGKIIGACELEGLLLRAAIRIIIEKGGVDK